MAPGIRVEHLDRTVRPCDDFYSFANGSWLDATQIPPEEPGWGAFTEVRDRNQAILREILEQAAADPGAPAASPRRQVGDLFASGMDTEGIERAGLAPLREPLETIASLAGSTDLPRVLAALHGERVFPLFALYVWPDAKEPTENLLQIQQAGLGLPDRDYYLKQDERSQRLREQYVAHVGRMLGLFEDGRDSAADAAAILRIETALAEAAMSRVDQRDPYKIYHRLTSAELAVRAPDLDWAAYLAALGVDVPAVNARQPEFLRAAAALLAGETVEDLRTYLRWHLITARAKYLPARFVDEHFAFYGRVLQGVPEQKPRWKRVLETVDGAIGEALGRLYVERAFPEQAKRKVLALVEDLRVALGERIDALEWMSEPTKQQARAKLAAFRVKMGYPDVWRDYSRLEIDRGSYAANITRAERFEMQRSLAKLGRPVDREEWRMSPPTVNAYYAPPYNEIVFPAGILQPPFFDPEADDAVNYGAIGMVIGHEMTHGFDDSGSQYDAEGRLREWWTPEDRAGYTARTDIVVRQYEGYEPLPGERINGRLTLGENIADLGGLKVALAGFRRCAAAGAQTIDGFTAEQRFFLGFAQAWRSMLRDEMMRMRLTVDPHSPARYRCNGPLSNLPEFFDVFACAGDGGMARRPEDRPAIW